jgi:hypothetical protein
MDRQLTVAVALTSRRKIPGMAFTLARPVVARQRQRKLTKTARGSPLLPESR